MPLQNPISPALPAIPDQCQFCNAALIVNGRIAKSIADVRIRPQVSNDVFDNRNWTIACQEHVTESAELIIGSN